MVRITFIALLVTISACGSMAAVTTTVVPAVQATTTVPLTNYKVIIDVPLPGNRATSEGRFSLKIGDRVIDLPMTNTTIRAGQPLRRQITTTAIRPTNLIKLRWSSILRNNNDPMILWVNNVKIEGVTGSQTYCGSAIPQQLNHTIWHDFSTTTCVHK